MFSRCSKFFCLKKRGGDDKQPLLTPLASRADSQRREGPYFICRDKKQKEAKKVINKMRTSVIILSSLLTIILAPFTYEQGDNTCTSDEIRQIMMNSCNHFDLRKQQISFDLTLCCDPSQIKICRIYLCH